MRIFSVLPEIRLVLWHTTSFYQNGLTSTEHHKRIKAQGYWPNQHFGKHQFKLQLSNDSQERQTCDHKCPLLRIRSDLN